MIRRIVPGVLFVFGMAALVLFLGLGLSRPPLEEVDAFTSLDLSFTLAFAMFLPMGAFIAAKRPDNPIGWIACGIGCIQILTGAAYEYGLRTLLIAPGSLPLGPESAWLSAALWIPGFTLVTFLLLLFPTGSLPSPRWRWVGWLSASSTLLLMAALMSLWPERGVELLLNEDPSTPLVPGPVLEIAVWLLFLAIVGSFTSVVVRFRRSVGVERQQLKWMAFVAGVGASLVVATFLVEAFGHADTAVGTAVEHLLNLSAGAVPIAAGIAVLRYRLYDIDLIINRTLVYGALTAILAGIYIGLVFGLQAVLAPVTAESDLAIAGSTLAVAALFRPVRARVQAFIDKRFYRRKFDAHRTLEDFNEQLRDEVDLTALSLRLEHVVSETMQPAHVSLWLRGAS